MKAVERDGRRRGGAVRALVAGVDALCVGHDLGEEAWRAIVAALVARSRRNGCARPPGGSRRLAVGAAGAEASPIRGGADAARRALRSTATSRSAGRGGRRAAAAREHRRRRGTSTASTRARRARGRAGAAAGRRSSCATRTATRGCATAADRAGVVVVEVGPAGLAAERSSWLCRDVRRQPRLARRGTRVLACGAGVSSHLEQSSASSRPRSRG